MTTRTMHSGVPVARRLSPSDSQGAGPPMVSLSRRLTTLQGTPGPVGWSPGGVHRWQGHAFRSVLLRRLPCAARRSATPPSANIRTARIQSSSEVAHTRSGVGGFRSPIVSTPRPSEGPAPAGPGCVSRQPSTAHRGSAGELRCEGAAGARTALNGDRRSLEPQTGARSGGAAARSDRSPAEGRR
jgi:hypothetical protein